MNLRQMIPGWKSLISVIVATLVLLLVGVGFFQSHFSVPVFAWILFLFNLISYITSQQIFRYLGWNKSLVLNALRHLAYCVLSAVLIWTFSGVDRDYLVAYFSAFIVAGTVFGAFDYLLNALQELAAVKPNNGSMTGYEREESGLFRIDNSKGRVVFSVPATDILLLESDDNYLTIYYLDEGQCKKRTERLSLNQATSMLNAISNNFLRIHKSFLVNRQQVIAITGKSQNHHLKVNLIEKEIPVSRRLNIHQILPGI